MAYTQTVPIGRVFVLASGVVYALPPAALQFMDQGAGTVQTSLDGSTWSNATGNEITGKYVRSDGGDSNILITHH